MRTSAPSWPPSSAASSRLRILASLFLYGGQWSIGELAAHAEVSQASTSREVQRVEAAGLIKTTRRGQLHLIEARAELPWARPLVELLDQTVGPTHHIRALLDEPGWAGIDEVHIFGSWARRFHGEPGPPPNDLDVVLVSEVPLAPRRLLQFQRDLQQRTGLPVDAFSRDPQGVGKARPRPGPCGHPEGRRRARRACGRRIGSLRRMGQLRRAVAVTIGTVVGFVIGVTIGLGVSAAVHDVPPTGPACDHYQRSSDSGSDASGTEAILWTPMPERMCLVDGLPPSGGSHLIDWTVAGLGGVLVATIVATNVDAAIRRRDVAGPRKSVRRQ